MSQPRSIGQVKWFNNKSGYGFIGIVDGDESGEVFVHHSAIRTKEDQFRYLVQGEYVMLDIVDGDDGKKMASEVRGICEGELMCEVRAAAARRVISESGEN